MKRKFDGYNWLLRLDKGDLLIKELSSLAEAENLQGAWISGLGGALWAELGFYDLDAQKYRWKKLDQLLEITNLQGTVAWQDDRPAIHVHGTFSTPDMKAFGGHVKELEVGGTCEIMLHTWHKGRLNRGKDTATGLNTLRF